MKTWELLYITYKNLERCHRKDLRRKNPISFFLKRCCASKTWYENLGVERVYQRQFSIIISFMSCTVLFKWKSNHVYLYIVLFKWKSCDFQRDSFKNISVIIVGQACDRKYKIIQLRRSLWYLWTGLMYQQLKFLKSVLTGMHDTENTSKRTNV